MPYATIRAFLLTLAFLVAAGPTAVFACDQCGTPQTVSCVHQNILDFFQTGEGDAPAAYVAGSGFTTTASGSRPAGESATLTWSLVADGTGMPTGQGEPNAPSNLIAFLDNIHYGGPGPGGNDFTQRAWFNLIKSGLDRWDAISGLRIRYEPNDDGVNLGTLAGSLGRRGDIRIGGHYIDGDVRPSVLAYNYFPNNADMVIDTSEVTLLGNAGGNYLRFRNTIMHEVGHGLGLDHTASSDSRFLMEANLDINIDGPQFDEVLGVHHLYGDRFEELGGNDTVGNATNLGLLPMHQSFKLGEDAVDRTIAPTDVDFLSINKSADIDFFKFSVDKAGVLDIIVTPIGPSYMAGPHGGTQSLFNASALNDLTLFLYDSTGVNLLASSIAGGLGVAESILDFNVAGAGDFFVRIGGTMNVAQMYQLDIALVPEPAGVVLLLVGIASVGLRRRVL